MGRDQNPGSPAERPLNVLVLYDRRSLFTNTVREHVECFSRFSRHRIAYAHAAHNGRLTFPLDGFDAIILHYSIRLAFVDFISPEFAWALKPFKGLKALFIQDEYDHTWQACQWINQLGISLVFSCVPPEHVRTIYSKVDHNKVTFLQTLTGYLPSDSDLQQHVKPLSARPTVIGYRGRALPYRYGRLAREKLEIGIRMKAECEARGIRCNIAWTEDQRIYGPAWVDFVASCRATLGTESGSNVFDFDGTLKTTIDEALARNPKLTYEETEKKYLAGRELPGVMNQVSPRIFEAVSLRTGLILFEGTYSGVVRPDEHFIPLKKDFSNVDEVLKRVQDDRELQTMTDRAYRHVIESGDYSYQAFVRGVDEALSRHAGAGRFDALPAEQGWSRQIDMQVAQIHVNRNTTRGLARRAVRKAGKLPYKGAARTARLLPGMRKLVAQIKLIPAIKQLVLRDPVLGEAYRVIRSSKELRRASGSRYRLLRELLRLALLRHENQTCPTVDIPVWTSLRFELDARRIVFTTHPIYELPPVITEGQEVLAQAIAAVRRREIRQILWEHPVARPELGLRIGKLGMVSFYLGPPPAFRFTTLERLADLEPERTSRLLEYVGKGAHATSSSQAGEVETCYRRAS